MTHLFTCCYRSEAPRRGQGFEGHQVMAGQPSDNQMETAGAKTVSYHKSRVVRKPAFCIRENKDAD